MININIHGSCVSRDIFRFDKNEQFRILNYIGRNSIISLQYPKIYLEDFENINDYRKLTWEQRMIYFDCKKMAKQIIIKECDYLLIDLIDERFGILESELGSLTYSQVLQRSEYISKFVPYKIKSVNFSSEEFYNAYKMYSLFLREHFNVENIIIHEAYPVSIYMGVDNELHFFDSKELEKNKRLYPLLEKGYELLEEFLPEAKILRMPHNTIADEQHMWGKATVHYIENYYTEMISKIIDFCHD